MPNKSVSNINIPNALSFLRILMIPIALWAMMKEEFAFALAILVLAAMTDALDGFLARSLNQFTAVGRILDPMADKILFITLFTWLGFGLMVFPLWFTSLVLMRDGLILMGYFHLKKHHPKMDLKPRFFGKLNTVILFVLLFATLYGLSFEVKIPFNHLLGLVTMISIVSLGDYFLFWFRKK